MKPYLKPGTKTPVAVPIRRKTTVKTSIESAFNSFLAELWMCGTEPLDIGLTMSSACAKAIFGVDHKRGFDYMSDFGKIRITIKEPKHGSST